MLTPHDERELTREVTQIIAHALAIPEREIRPESLIGEELGADSLGVVNLIVAFEETYLVDIDDDEVERLRTAHDLVECVKRHMHGRSRSLS
jgi:acyl carrier protein